MQLPLGLLKRVLAGVVFGVYIAYLLYFLNPQLPISTGRIFAAVGLYGFICGMLLGATLWLARLARVRIFGRERLPQRRQGFGLVAFAVFVAGLVYWYHLAVYRIYLPQGAVRILSKATTLVAATAFVLFLLWLFDRTAGAARSRAVVVTGCVLVLISSMLLYQRRDGYRSHQRDVVYAELPADARTQFTALVAIRGLTQDWLIRLEGEGLAAFLSNRGTGEAAGEYRTRIEPFRSSSPKALWASLATGQLPSRHGVTGRFSYRTLLSRPGESFSLLPGGVGFRAWGLVPPVERLSAQLPSGASVPFWTAFERAGAPAIVVNWEGARPDTTRASAIISDRWIRELTEARALFPAGLEENLEEVRRAATLPSDIEMRIAPLAAPVRAAITRAMLNDARAARAALVASNVTRTSLTTVAFNGLADTIEALDLGASDFPSAGTPEGTALRAHVELLDRLAEQVSRQADVLFVVSPGSVQPPPIPGSITALASLVEERLEPGRNDGFLIVRGPEVRSRANPKTAEVIDVAPTLLYVSGLPVARDMDGSIIIEAFSDERLNLRSASFIPSYSAGRLVVRR